MKIIKVTSQQSTYVAKVASGLTAEDIAKQEHVSVPTVRYHLQGLKASMAADSMPHLVAKAIDQKLIKPDGQGGYEPVQRNDPRRGHLT